MSTAQKIHIFKSTTYRQTFETNAIITTPIIQALFIILNLASLSDRIKPDFISKQSQLELSQSGIGFVRGWNLAKS